MYFRCIWLYYIMPQTFRSQLFQLFQVLVREFCQLKMTGNQCKLAETINKSIACYKLLSDQTKERADLKRGEIQKFKCGDTAIQESFFLMIFCSAFHHGPSSSERMHKALKIAANCSRLHLAHTHCSVRMLLPTRQWAQQIQAKTTTGSSRGSSTMRETPIQFLAWEVPLEKGMALPTPAFLDSPGGSEGNEPACNTGDLSSFPQLGRSPGGRHDYPFQYFAWRIPWTEEPGRLYSPWGPKESDTTEWLNTQLRVTWPSLDQSLWQRSQSTWFSAPRNTQKEGREFLEGSDMLLAEYIKEEQLNCMLLKLLVRK